MSKPGATWCACFCVFLLTAARLHAAGFSIYEASARGNALGGALVGSTGDASANYYNPANLTELPGVNSMVGVTLINPGGHIETPTGDTSLRSDWFPPPHAYVSCQTSDRWWLGLGLYSEFGLGTKYNDDWPGRFNALETSVESFTINPNVAYKVNDRLSLAVGLRAMYLDFYSKRAVPFLGNTLGLMKLQGDSWGFGGTAALSYKITDAIDFGLVYRSRVKQSVEGNVEFERIALAAPPNNRTGAEADLMLPSSATGGFNYQATDKLNLGLALTWTEWSTYDALNIDFDSAVLPGVTQSYTDKNWGDVWRAGLGAEYTLTENWSLQGGYVYDMCPIEKTHADFMMPAGDRHIVGLGCGYKWSTWAVNLSYNYLMVVENSKTVTIAGTPTPVTFEGGFAHMTSLSVSKRF